jgi:hypothetical protein
MRILGLTQGIAKILSLLDGYNYKKNLYLAEMSKRHEEN